MTYRRFRLFSVLLALTALSSAFAVTAQPTPAAAHGSYQNGCTGVPDSGPYFNFHGACDRHDLCYHYKYYGGGYYGRLNCDKRFLSDMQASCRARYSYGTFSRSTCYGVAQTYYYGVRAAGWAFF